MKLHVKLLLYLLCSVTVVVTIAQVIQYVDTTGRLEKLTSEQIEMLAAREEENAQNVYHSIEQSVAGSLKRGEMKKFTEILADQKNVAGLMEFSLFDIDGKVTHSSHDEFVGKEISQEMKEQIYSSTEKQIVQSDEMIEIYQPTINGGDCFRCHTGWKRDAICGVTYFKFSTEDLAKAKQDAVTTIASAKQISLRNSIVTIFGVVVALAVTMFVVVKKYVQNPLNLFVSLLEKFERNDGDLTTLVPIESKDEIGTLARLFNKFMANLNQAIGHAQSTGTKVGEKASSQAVSVRETAESMETIASQTDENASRAKQANILMDSMTKEIGQANDAMTTLTNSMQDISSSNSETAKIIKQIDEIARQTNLLALNAAVEAARAGEAGQGFAIVAEEVQKLAQRSAESAGQISEMIEATIGNVKNGTKLVGNANKIFEVIADNNKKADDLIDEISVSSQEQSENIGKVNETLQGLDKIAQQNLAEAKELTQTMSTFKSNYTEQNQ